MEIKYSKEKFDGFTHRFIVKFRIDDDWRNDTNITIYSNCYSYQKLEDFINDKKSDKVLNFTIEHRASKEQDEIAEKFIDEMLGCEDINEDVHINDCPMCGYETILTYSGLQCTKCNWNVG